MDRPRSGEASAPPAPPSGLPELPISPYTNLVTATGMAQLHARRADAEQRLDELEPGDGLQRDYLSRHLRWLRARIDTAVPVGPRLENRDCAGFGARVELQDAEGRVEAFRIVGEDEADPAHALLSWVSPLARALEGAKVGEHVRWRRADEELDVTLTRLDYEDDASGACH